MFNIWEIYLRITQDDAGLVHIRASCPLFVDRTQLAMIRVVLNFRAANWKSSRCWQLFATCPVTSVYSNFETARLLRMRLYPRGSVLSATREAPGSYAACEGSKMFNIWEIYLGITQDDAGLVHIRVSCRLFVDRTQLATIRVVLNFHTWYFEHNEF